MYYKAIFLIAVILSAGCTSSANNQKTAEAGVKLTEPVQLTFHGKNDEDPSLARSKDGAFYLAWSSEQSGNADIWLTMSADGKNWEQAVPIINDAAGDEFYPSLIQSRDGTFHIAWFAIDRFAPGRPANIWYASSKDGINWENRMQITNGSIEWAPSIIADNRGALWIAWTSTRTGNRDIFVTYSNDSGKTWSAPTRVTDSNAQDDFAHLVQNSDGTYILAWTQYEQEGIGFGSVNPTADIFYSTSADGNSWSDPVVVSSYDAKDSFTDVYPALYEFKGNYFISWTSSASDPFGNIAAAPLSDVRKITELATEAKVDYFSRLVQASGNSLLMVWVSDRNGSETNKNIFSRFVEQG